MGFIREIVCWKKNQVLYVMSFPVKKDIKRHLKKERKRQEKTSCIKIGFSPNKKFLH